MFRGVLGGASGRRCVGRVRTDFVPVSSEEEVTKTTGSCPKALTASSDHCYCPQRPNIETEVRRREVESEVWFREREHKAASGCRRTNRHEGGV